MAAPIDIEVKDGVDSSIEKKITGIANAARTGHKALQDLQAALKSLNASALADITRASASHTTALAKEITAQAKMTDALNKGAIAAARAATEKQKLATESQRTAAAEANATRAATMAEGAALRLATAQQRAAAAKTADQKETERLAASAARLKAAIDPLGSTLDRLNADLITNRNLLAAGAITTEQFTKYETSLTESIRITTAAIDMQNNTLARGQTSTKAMTQATLNLSRQFADVGVTAAMGMSPIMILIQQGPQIADAFMTAATQGLTFKAVLAGLLAPIAAFVAAWWPVIAVLAAVAAATYLLTKAHSDHMKRIAEVNKQIDELHDKLSKASPSLIDNADNAELAAEGTKNFNSWLESTNKTLTTYVDLLREAAIGQARLDVWNANQNASNLEKENFSTARGARVYIGKGDGPFGLNLGGAQGKAYNAVIEQQRKAAETQRLAQARLDAMLDAPKSAFGDKPTKKAKGPKYSEAEIRSKEIADVNRELDSQVKNLGMVGAAKERDNMLSSVVNSLAEKRITLSAKERSVIEDKITAIVHGNEVQNEMNRLYSEATDIERKHNLGLEASQTLLNSGAISASQYAQAVAKLNYEYAQSSDSLFSFNQQLQDETELFGQFGIELAVATRLQALKHTLDAKGEVLTHRQTAALMDQLTTMEREIAVNSELQSIYEANQGAIDALTARTVALSAAHAQGTIGAEQYRIGLNNVAMEAANVAIRHNEMATSGQMALASLQGYMSTYQGLLPSLTQSFGDFFTTVADGFADSIARAIVTGESFSDMLSDIATQAITQLISSLIKLGIQWAITQAIGSTLGAGATALSAAQGAIVAAAWAPAAAMVSLATLGANALPAAAAIASTSALTSALAAIPHFASGGEINGPGGPKSDKIPIMASNGEFIVNARAANDNLPLLQAINNGWDPGHYAEGGTVSAPSTSTNYSSGSSYGGDVNNHFDFSGANFGGANPDEIEERFMQVVATELAPQILKSARMQANEDMTVRFVRPKIR